MGAAVYANSSDKKDTGWWLEIVGVPARIVIYACAGAVLYIFKPEDIGHKPLGSLTLSELFWGFGWGMVTVGLGWCLFKPSQDPDVRRAWGRVGMFLLLVAIIGSMVWARHNL
jgi:hypothetical protein